MRTLCWLVTICCTLVGSAQNLVPNGDLETHGDCSAGADFGMLTYWSVPYGCVEGMYANACTPPPNDIYFGVPQNILGYEPAYSGVGYLALRTFTTIETNSQRYVYSTLYDPLVAGQTYCVRLWMSRCDSSSFSTDTFHALLTVLIPDVNQNQDTTWAQDAMVTFNTSAVDEQGWYLLEGSFVAAGGERRLTLGDFLLDEAILADTTFLGYHYQAPYYAGYYIDDVYLGPCDVSVPEHSTTRPAFVYPNPVAPGQSMGVQWGSAGFTWRLRDARGEEVALGVVRPGTPTAILDSGNWSTGVYMLTLKAPDGTEVTQRIVLL
jgi:hypothetical protein